MTQVEKGTRSKQEKEDRGETESLNDCNGVILKGIRITVETIKELKRVEAGLCGVKVVV